MLLAGLVYLNALHNPFIYDDYHTVVENRSIVDLANVKAIVLGALTRPVVNFSYALDLALWGPAPFGFHVTSVLFHMLNVLLLFHLVKRLGKGDAAAISAAALFAVHPMMTEAVGYISGRSEVLCATFFMLALMSGQRWLATPPVQRRVQQDPPHVGRVLSDPASSFIPALATVSLWILALATKETAAMFPFVFLAYDYFSIDGSEADRRRRLMRIHLPLVATAVLAGTVRLAIFALVEYPGEFRIHWDYLLLEIDVIRRYLWMMAVPSGQSLFHEVAPTGLFDLRAWLSILVVGGLVAASVKLRRIDGAAGFGGLWFFLALVPSTALIALDQGEPMAEHRVYLASCGLFLAVGAAVGWLMHWSAERRPALHAAGAGLGLVIVSLGAMTVVRNAVWGDPIRIWGEAVALAPAHYRPRLLLGEALQDAGRREEALEAYRMAIRLRPSEPTGYVKIGQTLAEVGQWPEARRQFLKALEVEPQNVAALNALTVLDNVESRFGIDRPRR